MNLDMIEVEIRQFGVLVWAIDTELKDLSIWTIPIPPNLYFNLFPLDVPPTLIKSNNPYRQLVLDATLH